MRQKTKASLNVERFEKAPFNLTPGRTILLTLMAGSFVMFVFLLIMMLSRLSQSNFLNLSIPEPFVVSTWLLLVTSFLMRKTRDHLNDEAFLPVFRHLSWTMLALSMFSIMQIFAWFSLYQQVSPYKINTSLINYIYFISGMHFLHALILIGLITSIWWKFLRLLKNPVAKLIIFTDKSLIARFRNAEIFCHYTDGIWILIFISLLFT